MKKIVIIVCVLLLVLCCGCDRVDPELIAELSGSWYTTQPDTQENAKKLLEAMEAYEEELALADLESLSYSMVVEFDQERNYSFRYDAEGTTECVEEFLRGYFSALYEGRTTLKDAYGIDFTDLSEEEFFEFYAQMYDHENIDSLVEDFAEGVFDESVMGKDWRSGTYTIAEGRLLLTAQGEEEPEQVPYTLEGNTLTLSFADETVVCTRK